MFVVYRLFLFVYLTGWMVALAVDRRDMVGVRWLIFVTNWTLLLLSSSTLLASLVTLFYAAFCSRPRDSQTKTSDDESLYRQDNINWVLKIFWFIYISSHTAMIMIFFGFWIAVYEPCEDNDDGLGEAVARNASSSSSGFVEDELEPSCGADALSIHAHGVTAAIVFLDVILGLVPFQALHALYPSAFTTTYIIFSAIYFAAGGTNELGEPFIYSILDYGDHPGRATFGALLLIFVPIAVYILLFLVAYARDRVYWWINVNRPNYCCAMMTCMEGENGIV